MNEVKDPAPAGIFGVAEGRRLIALDITQVGISDDGDPFNSSTLRSKILMGTYIVRDLQTPT